MGEMRRTAIYYKYLNVGCEWEMVLKSWKVAGEDKGANDGTKAVSFLTSGS